MELSTVLGRDFEIFISIGLMEGLSQGFVGD